MNWTTTIWITPSIQLICSYYSISSASFFACSGWSNYYTLVWSQFKNLIFWPFRRRGSYSFSTFILILWTSRSLYLNFTRVWSNFTYHFSRKDKGCLWQIGHNLCYTFYWSSGVYRLSSSHVYCGDRCR